MSEREEPLARQLDLRDGQRVHFAAMPEDVADEIDEYALELRFVENPAEGIDAAHVFLDGDAGLEERLATLRRQIAPDGQIWVSWSRNVEGLGVDRVRAAALPLGLVDTREMLIAGRWPSLKLVIRKDLR